MTISPQQLRAARALIGWTSEELSIKSGVPGSVIDDYEAESGHMNAQHIDAVVHAFRAGGVLFVSEGTSQETGGVGVRFGGHPQQGTRPEELNSANDI